MLIIPTYNERENVGKLVEKIREAVGEISILFVDDNSPDGTSEALEQLRKKDPLISILRRPKKEGLGPAYRAAFKKVIDEKLADFVITMDADHSHDPAAVKTFIKELRQFPVVVGSRYVRGGKVENWNWFRRLVSYSGNVYARTLIGLPVTDLTSGYVGYRTGVLAGLDLENMIHDGYAFQIELKHLLHSGRHQVKEIPIVFTERREGKSKFNIEIILEAVKYPIVVFLKRIF